MFGFSPGFCPFYWLLQQWSAITLSLIIYITPLVALLWDFCIRGVIHLQAALGMLIIFSECFCQFTPQQIFRLGERFFKRD